MVAISLADARVRMTDESKQAAESEFVTWLKEAMAKKQPGGVPARQVAKYAGISHSALSSILRGENRPRLETVYKLAEYFGVDPAWLAGVAGYTTVKPAAELPFELQNLPPDLQPLVESWAELSPENRELTLDIIRQILARQRRDQTNMEQTG